jgi:Icc-related predicted phosphoesterase
LTFALFSDPHYFYDELASAVKSINEHKNISFVAIDGDITHLGLAKEYEYFWRQVKKLHYPYVTIIGNHDHLSNGKKVFEKMFGPVNYSFKLGEYKFITFNSVVWENGNTSPDFDWLNNEISTSDEKCVVFSHIPPWTDQFTKEYTDKYYSIMATPKVIASIHGHQHHYEDTIINAKRYFVTEAVFEHEYYIIHLIGNKMDVERINF